MLEMLSRVWAKFSKGNEKRTPKIKKVKIRKIGLRALVKIGQNFGMGFGFGTGIWDPMWDVTF